MPLPLAAIPGLFTFHVPVSAAEKRRISAMTPTEVAIECLD